MASDSRRKERLPTLTKQIVDTYRDLQSMTSLGQSPLPSKESIVSIIDDLREILYPGFGRQEGLHLDHMTDHVGDLMASLHDRLATQIARAYIHENRINPDANADTKSPDHLGLAQNTAITFLESIPQLRSLLDTDLQAAFDGDPACQNREEVILCYPGFEAITVYRLAYQLLKLNVPFIPRIMTEYAHKQTGIDIHPGAQVGPHFFIDHGTGVVIGETCEIGSHVKIYQGVTLGALSFPTDHHGNIVRGNKRHPTIENNVVIYANATILGGKTVIGHDSVIGSSVWLTAQVDPHTTVTIEKPNLRMRAESSPELEKPTDYHI